MRSFLVALTMLASSSAFAANHCDQYAGNTRFLIAIQTLAAYQNYTFEQLCTDPRLLTIEVQPNRIILPDFGGTEVPAVRVDLHSGYQTCSFQIRDSDQAVVSSKCYSGF